MMKIRRILSFAALVLLAVPALAQELPGDPEVRKGQLDNGLTYYIRHNSLPEQRAEFYLATNVGAIQETPDQDGLAHFLEHMCFNGTKNFPGKGILNYLQSIGASFGGNVNASTGVEQTIYMLTNIPLVNETVVDSCLLIIHDYSHFVSCDPVEIDKERGVILEERRSRRNASWRMFEASQPYLYGDTKYNGCTVIGSEENLKTFKPESLVNFYQTWCRPDLQAVIVVGDIDVDAVEAKIKATWSDVPKVENPKPKDFIRIPGNEEPIVGVLTDPELTSSSASIYWKVPARDEAINNTPQGFVEDLLRRIVRIVMGERLGDIAAQPGTPMLNGLFEIAGVCESMDVIGIDEAFKDGNWAPAIELAMVEMEKLRRFGITDAELERAKSEILSSYESAANKADTRKNAEFVMPLIYNFLDNENYMTPQDRLGLANGILPQIRPDMVNSYIQSVLPEKDMLVLYEAPQKDGIVHPSADDIKAIIAKVKASDIEANAEEEISSEFVDPATLKGSSVKKVKQSISGATEWTLKNGVTIVLKPTDLEKDKIQMRLTKKGGISLIPTEDIQSFESNVYGVFQMNQGLSKFPCTEVNKMLSGKNVSCSSFIGDYTHGVSASSNVKDLETAFQLMYLQFCDPRFDPKEYEQSIQMIEPMLGNLDNMPQWHLQKAIISALYNGNARKPILSEEVLKNASLETIERVYRSLFNDAAGAVFAIVGDFDPEAVKPLVEKYIGSIPKGRKASKWVNRGDGVVTGNVEKDFNVPMETPKVTVVQVYSDRSEHYSASQEAAFDALKYILDMVYTDTLREEEGGTYGASTSSSTSQQPDECAMLQVAFETNAESADKLLALAKKGLQDIAEAGPSADYFDKALKNLQKEIPEARIRNSYWMNQIQQWYTYGLDYDTAYEAAVNALTAGDVQKAAQKLLASGNYIEVIMRPEKAE